jgi:RAQPRD family integrative conjugative element protein
VKLSKAALGFGLACMLSSAAHADAWQEREILTRVRDQLIRINKLLDQAQQAGADNQSRLRMEYPSIREDLRTIELGIFQYINTPMEPAPIIPLDGGYTDYQRASKKLKPADIELEDSLMKVQP